jgi:hypothetical protein
MIGLPGLKGRMMSLLWGTLTVLAGLLLLVGGTLKREFPIYRFLVYRSKILWGDHVYRFHQISGVLVILFGLLMLLGYF